MADRLSGGTKIDKLKYVEETTYGNGAPSNPQWNDFSSLPNSVTFTLSPQKETITPLGEVDPQEFVRGRETHEASVEYRLSSNISDTALIDGVIRNNNAIPNSHAIVAVEDDGTRKEITYLQGGKIDSWEIPGELGAEGAGGDNPIVPSIDYIAKKIRKYSILQPNTSSILVISSDSVDDTTQTLTIEDEGASQSENVSLNGSTNVSTTSQFGSIEALSLDAETEGDVTIKDSSNDSTLATIKGSSNRGDVGGDLGTPTLGNSSWGSANTSLEHFVAGAVEKPSGSDLAYVVQSITVSGENNLEKVADVGEVTIKDLEAGARELTAEVDIATKDMRERQFNEVFGNTEEDLEWSMENGNLILENVQAIEPGDIEYSEGDVYSVGTVSYTAKNVSVGS